MDPNTMAKPMNTKDVEEIEDLIRRIDRGDASTMSEIVAAIRPPEWITDMFKTRHRRQSTSGTYNSIYEDRTHAPTGAIALRVGRKPLQSLADLHQMLRETSLSIQTAATCPAPAVYGYGVIDGFFVSAHELFHANLRDAFQDAIADGQAQMDALAEQVASAIQCLMVTHRLVHTDIKAPNMVVRQQGTDVRVAIIDFDPKFVVRIPALNCNIHAICGHYILWMLLQIELTELIHHIQTRVRAYLETNQGQNAQHLTAVDDAKRQARCDMIYETTARSYTPRLFTHGTDGVLRVRSAAALPGLDLSDRPVPWNGDENGDVTVANLWHSILTHQLLVDMTKHYMIVRHDHKGNIDRRPMGLSDYMKRLEWLRIACQ